MNLKIFISGSLAKGIGDVKDIDLVYITQDTGYIYSELFETEAIIFHVIYLPEYKLVDIITHDLITPDRTYINLLKGSISINKYDSVILKEIKEYIDYMESKIQFGDDNDVLYHITHIQELSSEISDKRNNSLVLASDLFLTLLRFVTTLHHTTAKHLGRAVCKNNFAQKLCLKYIDAIKEGDFEDFMETANTIISPYLSGEYKVTTGVSYNIPPRNYCVIFIPGNNSRTRTAEQILSCFEESCKARRSYSFYICQNQVMNHGTYLFIQITDKINMNQLYDVHKKYADTCIAEDLKIIFPYNTAFCSGYYFGGYEIFERLIPLFYQLHKWIQKDNNDRLLCGIKICKVWLEKVKCSFVLMTKYLDYLALYAIDPNCIYNIHQTKYMKQAMTDFYINHSIDLDIQIEAGNELNHIVNSTIQIAERLKENEIHIISTPLSNNKREILLFNILDHFLAICKLDAGEKYAIVYHSLKTHNKP